MMCLKGVGNEPTVEEATRFIQVRIRLDRAVKLTPGKIGQGLYEVPSQRDPRKKYVVDLLGKTCTCMDFTIRGGLCKHLLAAKLADDRDKAPVEKNFHYEEVY
jgi:predicted nucleic acid-binding Zn finger protein